MGNRVRVGVVPEVVHLVVYHYFVVETHDNVLHGGFDDAVAAILDELFIEIGNSIHAVMVLCGCQFHHVKTTSAERAASWYVPRETSPVVGREFNVHESSSDCRICVIQRAFFLERWTLFTGL